MKRYIIPLLVFLMTGSLWAQSVLATNAWTAAFAAAAGAEDVSQLAPSEMTHPPEYELRPSDVRKVADADVLIFAGYETLMKTVLKDLGAGDEKLVKIMTSYNPDVMERSLMQIAAKAGDPAAAAAYMESYRARLEGIRSALRERGIYGAEILVHFHQKPLAEALGFRILGVFGPAPLKASEIARLGSLKPALILDNAHNPMAPPLTELSEAPTALLMNFPGGRDDAGRTIPGDLEAVATYNGERILELK